MTDPAALETVRGDSLEWRIEFTTDPDGEDPWSDFADYDPLCQIREDVDAADPIVPTFADLGGGVARFRLTATQTAALKPRRDYVWDVEFTDPTAATGMGVFTWPPAGEARGTLTVTPDVAKSS